MGDTMRCTIFPNWNTNKKGKCKRYYLCKYKNTKDCVAKGGI